MSGTTAETTLRIAFKPRVALPDPIAMTMAAITRIVTSQAVSHSRIAGTGTPLFVRGNSRTDAAATQAMNQTGR